MTLERIGMLLALAGIDSGLLLGIGIAMWRNPPTAAEEAVGKGLVVIGTAVAIPTFVFFCEWLGSLQQRHAEEDG